MSGPFAGPPGGVPVRSFSSAESSILSLGKNASELAFFSRLIRTLASPKILHLGKNASELAFFSRLIRIFNAVGESLLTTNELEEIHM